MANFPIGFYSFNPRQVAGLVAWFDSNDPAGNGVQPTNGSSISTLVDKSKNGNNLSQSTGSNQPIFNKNQFNGLASILYTASSSQYLTGPVLSNTLHTVFISYKASTVSPQNTAFYNGNSSTSGYGFVIQTGNTRDILFGGVTYKDDGTATTSLEQVTFSWNGTTSIMRINGTQQTLTNATSAPNSPPIGTLQLGKDSGSQYWNGYINEVLVYNTGSLNATSLLAIENYLKRW